MRWKKREKGKRGRCNKHVRSQSGREREREKEREREREREYGSEVVSKSRMKLT